MSGSQKKKKQIKRNQWPARITNLTKWNKARKEVRKSENRQPKVVRYNTLSRAREDCPREEERGGRNREIPNPVLFFSHDDMQERND